MEVARCSRRYLVMKHANRPEVYGPDGILIPPEPINLAYVSFDPTDVLAANAETVTVRGSDDHDDDDDVAVTMLRDQYHFILDEMLDFKTEYCADGNWCGVPFYCTDETERIDACVLHHAQDVVAWERNTKDPFPALRSARHYIVIGPIHVEMEQG